MTNKNSFLKLTFGDSVIGKSWIVKKAWEMVKKLHISMSEAFTRAWEQAKKLNEKLKTYKINVRGIVYYFTSNIDDVIAEGLEVIGGITGNKKLLHNLSTNIYKNYNKFTEFLENKKSFTYMQDIYIIELS